ncbi:hypothetical protein C5S35_06440 [Candidatus Methanophagaceae archaeon]|nr:hypothetical protein C5S35_06440 [Methanophagales archaeon]
MEVLLIFGFQKRLRGDMRIIGSAGTLMGRFTDTITFLTRDGDLLKLFPSISITVPKAMFVRA